MSRNPLPEGAQDIDPATVRFDDVSMRYGRAPETLRDLSFSLEPGSFHFVTGASGAGKSSLLKLIYLAAKPSKGLVHLFGQDVSAVPLRDQPFLRRRIGVVFQEFRLLEHMSAFDNVALPLRLAGRKPQEYRTDAAELLTWVGLTAIGIAPNEALVAGLAISVASTVVRCSRMVSGAMGRRLN